MEENSEQLFGNTNKDKGLIGKKIDLILAYFPLDEQASAMIESIRATHGNDLIVLDINAPDFKEQIQKLSLADNIQRLLEKEKMIREKEFIIKRNPTIDMPVINYADGKDERALKINRQSQQYSQRKHNFKKK